MQNQRQEIRAEGRAGKDSAQTAHRLLVANRYLARKARMHGGHLTRIEARKLKHQAIRIHRDIRS